MRALGFLLAAALCLNAVSRTYAQTRTLARHARQERQACLTAAPAADSPAALRQHARRRRPERAKVSFASVSRALSARASSPSVALALSCSSAPCGASALPDHPPA